MSDEQSRRELEQLVHDRVRAVAAHDVDALVAAQSADIRSFNLLPPTEIRGNDGVADQTRAWFDGYRDGPGYEVSHLDIDACGDLGYCAFFYHVTGELQDGQQVSMWVRATLVCRREDGTWRVVHDHESIPWDARSGQGLPGLAPN